jgi:methylated-DNA-[protein]-cysteine S-methyltransferase
MAANTKARIGWFTRGTGITLKPNQDYCDEERAIMKLLLSTLGSSLGELMLASDETGTIRALDFVDHQARYYRHLREHCQAFESVSGSMPRAISEALYAYFEGDCNALDKLEIAPAGTEFQRRVWAQLRLIPAGHTMYYGEIARQLGFSDPRIAIDVGAANGAKPIAIVVPCHRVVAKNGDLKGYAWGLHRKRWLLEHEGAQLAIPLKGKVDASLSLPGF